MPTKEILSAQKLTSLGKEQSKTKNKLITVCYSTAFGLFFCFIKFG